MEVSIVITNPEQNQDFPQSLFLVLIVKKIIEVVLGHLPVITEKSRRSFFVNYKHVDEWQNVPNYGDMSIIKVQFP
jgi:hypothetical protein